MKPILLKLTLDEFKTLALMMDKASKVIKPGETLDIGGGPNTTLSIEIDKETTLPNHSSDRGQQP